MGYRPNPEIMPISKDVMQHCKLLATREEMLDYLPKNSVCAEVGIAVCGWSRMILDKTQPKELHLIDIKDARQYLPDRDNIYFHQGDSSKVLKNKFPDKFFDWIYIDGDHRYGGVKADTDAAIPKLKDDGLLVFNDYIIYDYIANMPYGVVQVINSLCNQGWEMIYYAINLHMFSDVVLRRRV